MSPQADAAIAERPAVITTVAPGTSDARVVAGPVRRTDERVPVIAGSVAQVTRRVHVGTAPVHLVLVVQGEGGPLWRSAICKLAVARLATVVVPLIGHGQACVRNNQHQCAANRSRSERSAQ